MKVVKVAAVQPKDGSDPAFPFPYDSVGMTGLTKREYFAAVVLGGMAANPDEQVIASPREAVEYADRLIEELNK